MPSRQRWIVPLFLLCATSAFAAAPARSIASTDERFHSILRHEIDATAPGAAVLVAKGDQVIFRVARGSADIELATPLQPQQVFRIGSITKTLTAATILKLAATGELSPDAPLSRYLPEYPNGENIPIARLLDHTAGVSDAWDANPAEVLTTAELLRRIERQPADFPPGADWRYSNSGYILLGAIIEKVTGKAWCVAVRDLLLAPLAMTRSGCYLDNELVPGRVEGYSADTSGAIVRAPFVSMTGPGAAGALSSTVDDLFRFTRALVTGRVLPADLYARMTTAKTTASGRAVDYGYGVMLGTVRGEPVVEHNGGIDGFASQLTYFPKQQVTVVVLANTDAGRPNPRSLAHRLGALAIGHPYPNFRDAALDASTVAGLVGSYRSGPSSMRTLSVRHGRLFVRRDKGPERALTSAEGDVLYFPGDATDYFRVIRDARSDIEALEFHPDGMEPGRREPRIK
jgi:CubicO group peptidase (beta-lactamase class C family)